MARDLNNLTIIGRLTKDVEMRHTQSGKAVASFSIAVNTGFGENEKTSFFNVVAWGKLGETINEYCKKGNRVGVQGRIEQRTWEDASGNKRSTVEIIAENVQFLTPKGDSQTSQKAQSKVKETFSGEVFDDDDIPY